MNQEQAHSDQVSETTTVAGVSNQLSQQRLQEMLEFFVKVGQEKILTKVNGDKTTANNLYYRTQRVNTSNNTVGRRTEAWRENMAAYQAAGLQESWFDEGLSCIHFANGNTQNKNYAWRNASLHLSFDQRYAVEFMFEMDKASGDNLIWGLCARLYQLNDASGAHTNNTNAYTSSKRDDILFKLPVTITQAETGQVTAVAVAISAAHFALLQQFLTDIARYFTHTQPNQASGGYRNKYSAAVLSSGNVIFRGAPGTGKSHLAQESHIWHRK